MPADVPTLWTAREGSPGLAEEAPRQNPLDYAFIVDINARTRYLYLHYARKFNVMLKFSTL